jgi:hypothetical protein
MKNYSPEIDRNKERQIDVLAVKIKKDLQFDEGLADFQEETRKTIAHVIAETIIMSHEILKIPIPDIKLIDDWDEWKDYLDDDLPNYDAEAYPGPKMIYKDYEDLIEKVKNNIKIPLTIEIHPIFLLEIANSIENKPNKRLRKSIPSREKVLSPSDRLRVTMGHEMHHIWQFILTPKRYMDPLKGKTSNEDYYHICYRAEYAADLYAHMLIKNRKTSGFIDKMNKLIASISTLASAEIKKELYKIEKSQREME